MNKNRDNSLDIISGIMITWMVVYHIFMWAGLTGHPIYKIPLQWLFFFMPWFYFKSGMHQKLNTELSIINYIINNTNSLIVPLIIWTTIGILVSIPEMLFFKDYPLWKILIEPFYKIMLSGDTYGNPPLWFLCSLFIVKIIGYYLIKQSKYTISIFLLLCIGAGIILSKLFILLPLGIHNVVIGIIFYYSGYIYKNELSKIKTNHVVLSLATSIFIIINLLSPSYIDIHLNILKYGSYFGYFILSIFAIILSIRLLENKKCEPLAWIGRKSMYILVMHWPILTIIKNIYETCNLTTKGLEYSYVLLAVTFPLLIFLSARIPPTILNYDKIHHIIG